MKTFTAGSSLTSDPTLPPDLSMDAVTLRVGDLEVMTAYYSDSLGLSPLEERSSRREVSRVLGRGGIPLVKLVHTPDLPGVDPRAAGLFHTAFLFEPPEALAAAVYRTARTVGARFAGSSDHLVSEAFYFADPEGNGIELYVDRPREQWRRQNGELQMDTLFLDPNAFLQEHLNEGSVRTLETDPASVGHVHLQVGNIDQARASIQGLWRCESGERSMGTQVTPALPGRGAEALPAE